MDSYNRTRLLADSFEIVSTLSASHPVRYTPDPSVVQTCEASPTHRTLQQPDLFTLPPHSPPVVQSQTWLPFHTVAYTNKQTPATDTGHMKYYSGNRISPRQYTAASDVNHAYHRQSRLLSKSPKHHPDRKSKTYRAYVRPIPSGGSPTHTSDMSSVWTSAFYTNWKPRHLQGFYNSALTPDPTSTTTSSTNTSNTV